MIKISKVRKFNDMKIGLVLAGGGAKGAYEAGVFEALYDLDIADKITACSGTSIGALNTLLLAMGERNLCRKIWENIELKNVLTINEDEKKVGFVELLKQIKNDTDEFTVSGVLLDAARNEAGAFSQESIKELLMNYVNFDKIRNTKNTYYACAYDIELFKPKYFCLNEMTDDDIISAVLASSAIPYVYPPVTIHGRRYADGGINSPAYPVKNADIAPILPLGEHELNFIIVVRLDQNEWIVPDVFESKPIIQIFPSQSLEALKGTGTLDFSQKSVKERMTLGYRDAVTTLAPMIFKMIKSC